MERIDMESANQSKYPVKLIQTLEGGTAHVILFSTGQKYVVKWNGTETRRKKEVVNEYVVSKLAELLSLPIIPFELVYIPKSFIENTPELKSKKYYFNPGYHYGCIFIENCVVFEKVRKAPPAKEKVQNRDMLAGITVFDQWVNNSDRSTMNVILERRGKGHYYVHMIDHGRCFPGRYEWSAHTLTEKPQYNFHWPFYKWVMSLLDDFQELKTFAEKIAALPNEMIYETIESIPQEWNVPKEEREALYGFLVKQKDTLPHIVKNITNYYKKRR